VASRHEEEIEDDEEIEEVEDGLPSQKCLRAQDAGLETGWVFFSIQTPEELRHLCGLISVTQSDTATVAKYTNRALSDWVRSKMAASIRAELERIGIGVTIIGDPTELMIRQRTNRGTAQ
jgi:hypothetical protein